ncbi:hypothetical protein GWK47_021609 [Chionoecetes opilio]|uniref:Secreted protein n=1 Tax=Chionoecetes opilio TaxID=41210 RepID=A0A8J4XPA5_CHIOP|nr:hypothetical protein GWK47_021609 [Chionoecetes opilio]
MPSLGTSTCTVLHCLAWVQLGFPVLGVSCILGSHDFLPQAGSGPPPPSNAWTNRADASAWPTAPSATPEASLAAHSSSSRSRDPRVEDRQPRRVTPPEQLTRDRYR